jgi:hypothetical protein
VVLGAARPGEPGGLAAVGVDGLADLEGRACQDHGGKLSGGVVDVRELPVP